MNAEERLLGRITFGNVSNWSIIKRGFMLTYIWMAAISSLSEFFSSVEIFPSFFFQTNFNVFVLEISPFFFFFKNKSKKLRKLPLAVYFYIIHPGGQKQGVVFWYSPVKWKTGMVYRAQLCLFLASLQERILMLSEIWKSWWLGPLAYWLFKSQVFCLWFFFPLNLEGMLHRKSFNHKLKLLDLVALFSSILQNEIPCNIFIIL